MCETEQGLATKAGEISTELGFEHWALAMRLPGAGGQTHSVWTIDNLPPELRRAHIDCFVGLAEACGTSWMCDGVPYALWPTAQPHKAIGELACVRRLHALALQHGVQGCLCVPVPGHDGAAGSLLLATGRSTDECALNALRPLALLFSRYLHRACRPFIGAEQNRGAPRLSAREVECLSWAAMGKTNWEISRVLDISEHTVIFHLRKAGGKLGTVNRAQAIARSIQFGLLGPDGRTAQRERPATKPTPAQGSGYPW